MTDSPGTTAGQGTSGVAKEQAGQVGSSATQAAGQVAQTSKEQAQQVAQEASRQARDLAGELRTQVTDQASSQQSRLAETIRSLADELQQIGQGSGGQSGIATDLASQFSSKVQDVAGFLENRQPGELVDELRQMARRRPGAFLLGAAVAGVLAGRVTRGAVAAQSSDSGDSTQGTYTGTTAGALPVPSTTVTATNTDYATTSTYGAVDPTIDLTGTAAPGYGTSTHGTDAEGLRDPSTGPLSPGGEYPESGQSSRPQGWTS
jgi:hypothetical protein